MSKTKNKGRSLLKGSAIYSIGNIGTLVINFFLVPLYTFYLSQDDLGYFDLVASALVVIAPLFFGHIELSVLRWVLADGDSNNIKKVVSNCFFIFLIGLVIFSAFYTIFISFFPLAIPQFVYLYLVSNFIYILAKQIIRSVYSSMHYVATELAYTLIVLIVTILFVAELKLKAIFIAYAFASASLVLYLLILNITKKVSYKLINIGLIKQLLGYSAPLVPNTISLWLNNMSSKYLIVYFLTLSANGIFAIAFKFAYVIQILNKIFYFSFQDKMYRIYQEEGHKNYFSNTFNKYSGVLFAILYMLIGTQRLVIPFIIDSKFYEAINYIPILGMGVVFMSLSSIIGIVYQCEKKNLGASKTSLVSGLIILTLGIIIIPRFELLGASVVFALGNFIWLIYRYRDIQRFIVFKIPYSRFILYIFIALFLWVLTSYNEDTTNIIGFILSVCFSYFFNKNLIVGYYMQLLARIKSK